MSKMQKSLLEYTKESVKIAMKVEGSMPHWGHTYNNVAWIAGQAVAITDPTG